MPYKYWKLATKCFAANFNFTHVDAKKGTVSYVERHSQKFPRKALQYGCKVRYLPNAEREVEKRQKMDPALRDGIFVGYRLHTGGKWTEPYQVLDCEAYSEIQKGSGRTDYVHSVSEIYIPGSAGDDLQKHPTFPIADGLLKETTAPADEESAEETVDKVEDLQTDLAETLLTSERPNITNLDPADNAGGDGISSIEEGTTESDDQQLSTNECWAIAGDYLVRKHRLPRTTLFSPTDVPDDLPPIAIES
jgi:hypothetical protein